MSEYIYASQGEPLANERGEVSLAREEIVRCKDCKHCVRSGVRARKRNEEVWRLIEEMRNKKMRWCDVYDALSDMGIHYANVNSLENSYRNCVALRADRLKCARNKHSFVVDEDGFCKWGERK